MDATGTRSGTDCEKETPVRSADLKAGAQSGKPPAEGGQPSPMATIQDEDERLLARIGYRQVSHCSNVPWSEPVDQTNRNCDASSPSGRRFPMLFPSLECSGLCRRPLASPSLKEARPQQYGRGSSALSWPCASPAP